jgi:AcrR family transcriptional regulator
MARVIKLEKHTAKRNEILNTALQLVYSKGYDKMTIQDILDQLQMSKGAFYHYFDSKLAVLEAVVERMATEQAEPIFRSIVQDPSLTALEKLSRYFDMSTQWKTSNKAFVMELVKIWYSDENALAQQKMIAKTAQHLGPFFTEIINQGVREGVFTTPYPEITSQVTMNLIQDLAYTSSQMLLSHNENTFERAKTFFAAYSDVLERILGAPQGSVQLMTAETVKEWFSQEPATQS